MELGRCWFGGQVNVELDVLAHLSCRVMRFRPAAVLRSELEVSCLCVDVMVRLEMRAHMDVIHIRLRVNAIDL